MAKQALEGSRLNAFGMDPDDLTIVGLDTKDGREHPLYDERIHLGLTEEWVKNIMCYGVLEPVLVRKNGEQVEVIAGRQRVRGAREANKRLVAAGGEPIKVPCMVKRTSDGDAFGITLAENENRVDDSPIIRARKAQRYLDLGRSEEDVAVTMGLPLPSVKTLLNLLDLDDQVQRLVHDRRLSQTAAMTLRDLPREQQREKAEEYATLGVTVEEAKRQTKMRKSNGNGHATGEVRAARPGTAVLRKLAENEDFLGGLSNDARALLHWVLGEESRAKQVRGLISTLRELGYDTDGVRKLSKFET